MIKIRVLFLILCTCIVFVMSSDNPVARKLLQLEEVEQVVDKQLNLDKFLAAASEEYILAAPVLKDSPITIVDCLPGSVLRLTNIKVTPTELQKGKPISMKAVGVFTAASDVTNLHISANLNGQEIFKNDVAKASHQNPGPYMFSYDNNVPTFTPAGHWEVYVWCMNGDNKLACIKATFDT